MSQALRREEITFIPQPGEQAGGQHQTEKRKQFNLSRSKLPVLVIVLLLAYLAVSVGGQFTKLAAMNSNIQSMQVEMQELQQKNADLRDKLQMVQSQAYIEKTAREKLGLVKPGETRVVTVPHGTDLTPIKPPVFD